MPKEVAKRKAWVVTVLHHDLPQIARLSTAPVGDVIALLPSRSSKHTIEGALKALLQFFDGSDAADMAAYLRLGKTGRVVEWDADEKIARLGHNPQVYAFKTEVTIDLSQKALDEHDGHGVVSDHPIQWTTRRERMDRIKAEMDARTYHWPGTISGYED